MTLGRVVGTVVSTVKLKALQGFKIMIVQPIDPQGNRKGATLLALDSVQSGVGDTVLVLEEGNSSRMIIGDSMAPVRSMVVGIVDQVTAGGSK